MRNIFFGVLGLCLIALLAATFYQNYRRFHTPLVTTLYQAVTLGNGSVFYGQANLR